MDLTTLPDDALVEVLGYLGTKELLRCRGVCRRLRDAALHPDLWWKRSLSFSWEHDEGVRLVSAVLRLAPCLGKLTLHKSCPEVLKALLSSTSCAISELDVYLICLDAAQAAVVLASQAALGRLKSVSVRLEDRKDTTPHERMFIERLIYTQGLTSLSLQWCQYNPDSVDWRPSGDAVPSSLQRFEYRWQGCPLGFLSSVLQWHADTLQVVHLLPVNGYYPGRELPAGTAALLAALPNLRELKCPVPEDMPALLQCPALKSLYLVVPKGNESTPPLLRGAQQYLSQAVADRLKTLTLYYCREGYGMDMVCEDLVLSLAGPGSGAPSALRSLRLTSRGRNVRKPLPQLQVLASVLPHLQNLVSLDLGGPHTAEFLEAMDGHVLPRLERLRVYWPGQSGNDFYEWAHGDEPRGLLRRYHPRLHLELDFEHSRRICYFGNNAPRCRLYCFKVLSLFSHPEHDGQCRQKHTENDIRIVL